MLVAGLTAAIAGILSALTDAPAWADLRLVQTVEQGDHHVVIAEVTDVSLRAEGPEGLTLKELGLNYGG